VKIPYEELQSFTEVFAVGTAAAVVPIRSITMESTADIFLYGEGDNEPGPCCVKLTKALQDIQRGNAEDKFGWLDQVHTPESYEVSDS
jgi:branched-chain amino acid aminotransferase